MCSFYVEDKNLEDSCLGREVRFPTKIQAEQALIVLLGLRVLATRSLLPEVCESDLEPTTTFEKWNTLGW